MSQQDRIERVPFVVDDTPYACWEWDIRERNLEFLNGIDPDFYTYVVDAHAQHLTDLDEGRKAALAIRITYGMALETFFALLGALVQAPQCVYGWVMRYQVVELERVVKKIKAGEEVLTRLQVPTTFEHLSEAIHSGFAYDEAKKKWIAEGFARMWNGFASDFLDETERVEYNSAKHGLRTRLGGFTLRMGIEDEPGRPARPEAMRDMGGSAFGSAFFMPENLGEGKRNFRGRSTHRNWVPENMINGVHLASMSIANVVSFLKVLNGVDPTTCKFHNPSTPEAFRAPWALSPGVTGFNMDRRIEADWVTPMTREEILATYAKEPVDQA